MEIKYRIVRSATALFVERPYADVSTRDIALRAHVLEGGIYRLFGSKEGLFKICFGVPGTDTPEVGS